MTKPAVITQSNLPLVNIGHSIRDLRGTSSSEVAKTLWFRRAGERKEADVQDEEEDLWDNVPI